jgi:hypothetical protein
MIVSGVISASWQASMVPSGAGSGGHGLRVLWVGPELCADGRQVAQGAGYPDVLAGGARGHLALPRQPLGAAVHVP